MLLLYLLQVTQQNHPAQVPSMFFSILFIAICKQFVSIANQFC